MSDDTVITNITNLADLEDKKPFLTFIWGPRMGELYPIEKEKSVVGRSPDCDLWIEDGAISRKHFQVELENGIVKLTDLRSTNGTLVNGDKVDGLVLQDGDKIQISKDTILAFTYLDETRQLSEKTRYEMGVIDPVTNTYNKRFFLGRLSEEFSFAKRSDRTLSLILFDIDHFKKLNDGFGHLAGDLVLQKLGALVIKTVRTHDIIARFGGEEFVVLMRDTDCQNAVNLAERLRRIVETHEFIYEGKKLPVNISLGVSALGGTMKKPEDLVEEADRYLYESKNGGRNKVSGPCAPTITP